MVGVKRGDIWLVDLNPTKGSEQKGIRPCLVISNNIANHYSPTVCVIPLTSDLTGRKYPINVLLKKEEAGLKVDSLVLCGQLRTVTKERLIRKLSEMNPDKFPAVEKATALYLGFRNV